jgi:hypothetical protein
MTSRDFPRLSRPDEPSWALRKDYATWEATLRYYQEYGVEVQIFKQGDCLISWRFDTREAAVEWAEQARAAIEQGLTLSD